MTAALVIAATLAIAAPTTQPADMVLAAIHRVESSGRMTAPRGDGGRARGPLQIHEGYWRDSRVTGTWADCERIDYSRRVVMAYMRRYEPAALARGDAETLARLHNGGPAWRRKRAATDGYWSKIKVAMHVCKGDAK